MFQSTPVIANGRIAEEAAEAAAENGFNPRPLLLTGESPRVLGMDELYIGFNPRPLLLTGESENDDFSNAEEAAVSIHARYC